VSGLHTESSVSCRTAPIGFAPAGQEKAPGSFGSLGSLPANPALEESLQPTGAVHDGDDFERAGLVAVGDDVRVNRPEAMAPICQVFPVMPMPGVCAKCVKVAYRRSEIRSAVSGLSSAM
jgi:hypothetical protein